MPSLDVLNHTIHILLCVHIKLKINIMAPILSSVQIASCITRWITCQLYIPTSQYMVYSLFSLSNNKV